MGLRSLSDELKDIFQARSQLREKYRCRRHLVDFTEKLLLQGSSGNFVGPCF
jgi:hypothetical protein